MIQQPRGLTALALERILPNDMESEMAVLGAMLLDEDAANKVMEKIADPSVFYYAAHQVVYREACAMMDVIQQTIDPVVFCGRLRDKGVLEEIGGEVYITDLVTRVPTVANVDHYIQRVINKYVLRQVINVAHGTMAQAFDNQDDVEAILADIVQKVQILAEGQADGGFVEVGTLVKNAVELLEKMIANRGVLTGLETGFRDFDKLTSGLHGGEMIVIAARPSMGKTSWSMNVAEHVAIDLNIPVGVFSLEMSKEELTKRMISSRARVNLKALSEGFTSEREMPKIHSAASELMKAPLYIDDTAGLSVSKMRARAHRLAKSKGIKLLVIDYVQLMKCPGKQSDSNRQVEVSLISQGVKQIAKELGIPVIAVAQLNRKPDEREGGKPKLSDLRETGQLEQDADIVGLLVRPEMNEDDPLKKETLKGVAELIIAKHRNGATGVVKLTFLHEYTKFEDAARVSDADMPEQQNYSTTPP